MVAALFLSGLAGLVALASRRRVGGASPIPREEFPKHALATFALADTSAKEKVSAWLRDPFVREDAEHHPLAPKGRGMQRAVGELLTCTRCGGTWSALLLVGLRTASPVVGGATADVLALAGANDLMQSGFRIMVERANGGSG
jgi:hypothetical protein